MENKFDISNVISELDGTNLSLGTVLKKYNKSEKDLTRLEESSLYKKLYQCESCHFWIDAMKIDDNGFCPQCSDPD